MADVNISLSNSSKIEVHLYGQANIDRDFKFDVGVVNRELRITLRSTGNCNSSSLNLDVTVPHKTFKIITVNTLLADIILGEGVSTDYVKVKTQSRYLASKATFVKSSIETMNGDIYIYINAKENISAVISTINGDASAEFDNVGDLNLYTNSLNGDVKNRHKCKSGYTANVNISTINGDIKIN